jgi:hypothetical protein
MLPLQTWRLFCDDGMSSEVKVQVQHEEEAGSTPCIARRSEVCCDV